jgi:hypothetical protein
VTSRCSRLAKAIGLNPLLANGRKPRIIPMSSHEQRIQDELHRRHEQARLARAARSREPRS